MIQLRGITWDHPRGFDPMSGTARQYHELNSHVSIVWEKRSLQAFADQPLPDLCRQFDLLVVDHPHLEALATCGGAIPFDGTGHDDELDILATHSIGASHASYNDGTHQWALAIDAASQVAAFRADLLDEPPQDWNAMLELARDGRVLWPAKPVDAVSTFNTLLANRGTPLPSDRDSLISEDDAFQVLEQMRTLSQLVPSECMDKNPPQVLDWLASATNRRFAYCPLLYGYSNYSRPNFRDHEIQFADALCPGLDSPRGTQLGGAGISVSAFTQHPDIAQDYAFWVASAECQRTVYFDSGGQPANAVAWEDDRVNASCRNFFQATRRTLETAWMRPRNTGYLGFQDRAGTLINQFLRGAIDVDRTVSQLVRIHHEAIQDRRGVL